MAEELNLSEELTDNSLDLSSINTGSNYTTDLGEYSAKPASLDIYKNVVGNPLTGSNPKSKLENINTASLSPNEEAKLFDAKVQSSKSDYEKMRPYTYNGDVDGANFERYYSSNQYQKLGFSPFRDNEALYNSKMTFGDQFVRAASQWDNLALTGFKSGIRAWGTLFTDPLAPDIESAREMQKAMAIGNSNAGGIGGFVTNTFLNSAYTIGIAADFLAEEVALAGITAFTGGLAGEATLPGMAAKAGLATRKLFGFGEAAAKAGKNIAEASKLAQEAETVKKATDNIRGIRNFSDARTFYNSLKAGEIGAKQLAVGTLRTINPFENTLQALEKTDYATNLAKTVKTFGAFADDIVSIKTAVSEAKLEGGMVKIDANKALIDEYKRTHFDQEPDEKELAKIEALSGEEARRTAFWNLPAIMTSNKLLYNTMLAPIRKMVGRGSKVKMLDDIIAEKPLKANVAGGFTKLGEGLGSKARAAAKSLTKPKIYGQAGMSYLKANFAEGVQENIQEAISKGAINDALDVYKDPRMGAYKGYMAHFMEGMKDQFSAEGAETFAGGFLMGAFAQPIMAAPAWSFTKLSKLAGDKSKIEEAKKQRNETIDRQLKILNELSTDNLKYFAPDIIKAIKNGKLSDDLFTAIKEGKFKEAKDLQGEIEYNHIQTALETGKYDLFLDQLKDYKNLSTEEAAEAFAKYGIAKEDVGKALKAMDGVIARAEKIKQTYEEVATNFPNPFNPTQYEHGSEAYLAAVDASIAWKKAQQNLVFASHTFDQYSERLEKMYNSFSNLSNSIAKQDAQYLMSVLTLPNLKQEISLLKDEIKTLGSVPEQASAKAQKEKRLELLEQFQQELLAADKETNPEEKEKLHGIAQKTFNKYAKFLSKKNNTIVFDKELDDAYSLLKDGLVIQNERQGLANSINVLSSPKGFLNLQYRLQKAITEHGTEKERLAKELYENFIKLQEKNDALNEIQKQTGLILSPDYISEYQDALDKGEDPLLPSSFINPATNEKVTSGEKFNKALDLWEIHLAIIKETAKLKKEDVPEQTIIKKFNVNNYDEYPDELKAEIQKLYDEQIKNGDISDDLNIEEFALQNLAAKKLVKAYKDKLDKEEQASKTSAFQEYLSLSLDELKTKYNTVLQEFKTNPDLLEEKNKLQQALNYKIRQSIKMTPEQERALGLIKALSNKTVNKDKEDNKYIVNGEKKDTRVTKLVDQILEENYPDYSKFALFEKSAKPILEAYQKAVEDSTVKAAASNRVKYVDAIFDYINKDLADNDKNIGKKNAEKLFKEQFNDRKLKLFKEELKSNTSEANFKKLFEKYIYEETIIRGNIVDAIIRDYFEGKELIKPSSMSDKAFNKLRESLIQFEQKLIELNEIPVSTGLVLTGETTNTVNGKPETIAGEMDLLVVTPNGEYKIYDMKTSTSWEYFGNPTDKSAKKDRYSLQLSLYKNLLENLTGIKVTNLELIAFKTEEDLNGNIKLLEEETTASKTKIDYNKYKDNVSKYIPSKLEVAAPVPTGTTTPTAIETKKADIERRRQEELKLYEIRNLSLDEQIEIINSNLKGEGIAGLIGSPEIVFNFGDRKPSTTFLAKPITKEGNYYRIVGNRYNVLVDEDLNIISTTNPNTGKTYKYGSNEIGLSNVEIKPRVPGNDKLTNEYIALFNENVAHKEYKQKEINAFYDAELAKELYKEIKAGKIITDMTPAEQAVANKYITVELRKRVDAELDALKQPTITTDIKAKKDDIKRRRQEEYNTQYNALVAGQVLDNDGEPVYEEDKGISANRLSTLTDKKYGHGHIRTSGLNSLEVLEKLLDGSDFSGMFGKIGSGAYSTWESGKFIIVSNNINPTTNNKLNLNEIEIILNAGLSPFAQELANKYPNVIFKDFNGKKYDAELDALEGKPVEEFNELSIEKKFKTIVDELKPGEQISGVFQKGVYPNAADESSYHVVLDDGRVVRVTQFFKDNKLPIGEKVTIQKIKKSIDNQQAKDVIEVLYNGETLTYVRETTPKNEKAKVEVPVNKQATLETLNQNININSLEVAKDRNYEVIYESVENPDKNGRYMIEKVTENSVYLSNVSGKVEVKKENIPGQIKNIIDIKGPENNNDDINTAINNNEAVKKTKFNYSEQNDDELNDDITNNICNGYL